MSCIVFLMRGDKKQWDGLSTQAIYFSFIKYLTSVITLGHLCANQLFLRCTDKTFCELCCDGLSFLKSGSPEQKFDKHCFR